MSKKTSEVGYYSLIQYCPNVSHGEVANIGVLLFVPKTGFVDVQVTPTNHRVAHIFGGGIHKYDTLQRYKEGLSEWVNVEKRQFATLDSAKSFFAAITGNVLFTPIRGVVCPGKAAEMLETLYKDYFSNEIVSQSEQSHKAPSFSKRRVFESLQTKYGKEIWERLALLPALEVGGTEKQIQPAFAFQNKHFNVVFAKKFNPSHYDDQIGFGLLVANEMRRAQERYWNKSIPIILGSIPSSYGHLSDQIAEAFKRYKISFYDNEQILIDYIGSRAKPLPAFAKQYAASVMEPKLFSELTV